MGALKSKIRVLKIIRFMYKGTVEKLVIRAKCKFLVFSLNIVKVKKQAKLFQILYSSNQVHVA